MRVLRFCTKSRSDRACERPPAAPRLSPFVRGTVSRDFSTKHSPPYEGGEPPKAAGGRSHIIYLQSLILLIFCFALVSLAQSPQSLTLDEAINEAIASNLSLVAERYNLSVAEARIITARLRPNPVLSLGGDHLPLLGTEFNSTNMAGPPEYAVRTDFLLERGGKRDNRIAIAENNKEVVQSQLQNTIRLLVLDVQNAFVDVLQAETISISRARTSMPLHKLSASTKREFGRATLPKSNSCEHNWPSCNLKTASARPNFDS